MNKKEAAQQIIEICQPKFHQILDSEKAIEFVPRSAMVGNNINNNLNLTVLNMSWIDRPKTGAHLAPSGIQG